MAARPAIGQLASRSGELLPPVTVLRAQSRTIEVNGRPASVLGVRQPDGTFGITTSVGKQFRLRVENELDRPTLIHWHGLAPPWQYKFESTSLQRGVGCEPEFWRRNPIDQLGADARPH
jgi:FtsP/CotA-like multicopper oxidase with cupredoxin domain